ncbi:hypothetical protein RND81_10G208400 [Saponaria officinalis]|uniref:F-box associated beta-propeller type 1 domain-containing protein n=1 Tax=Saponaria officinalis TaxID=3572 RepID=A0AAW1I719_SAPOF
MNFRQFKIMSAKKLAKLQRIDQFESPGRRIPHDLILFNILPRLPANSLLRFKSVCKKWLSDISILDFQKSHFQFSSQIPRFLLSHVSEVRKMFFLSYNESENTVRDLVELRCNELDEQRDGFFIVDSCNGVLCIHIMEEYFCLWNPVTNQYKTVPHYNETFDNVVSDVTLEAGGFGYISNVNDYKIFAMFLSHSDQRVCNFYLFSLNSGTWKRLTQLDESNYARKLCNDIASCIDETLYWPVSKPRNRTLVGYVGFDLQHERMKRVVKVPWLRRYAQVDEIFKVNGCMSLCCRKKLYGPVSDVWTLKKEIQGGLENWVKLASFDERNVEVRGFTANGKCLVQRYGQLELIDPCHQQDTDTDVSEKSVDCDLEVLQPALKHVDSLMPF